VAPAPAASVIACTSSPSRTAVTKSGLPVQPFTVWSSLRSRKARLGEVCDVMATLETAGRSCMASARSGGRSSTMSAAPLSMSCAWRAGVALRIMTSLNSGRSPAQFGFGLSVIDRPVSTRSMT
jgi:hypothetical protein